MRHYLVLLVSGFICIQSDVRAASTDLVTIVFGSCARQDRPAPIWATMASNKPLMTVLLGDNIYADTKDMELMRAKYQMLASNLGFQSLRKSSPIMAVWDDHDYGMDDAGANYPQREASKKIILDFFEEPEKSARRSQAGGIYTSRVLGQEGKRIQIILLDTRYSRSDLKKAPGGSQTGYIPDSSSNAAMLSPEQWIWLEEQLKQPAEVRLIGSSIQVVSEDHRFEKWANMPAERSRLFETIRKSGANGVVILSGDRHLGEISSMDAGLGYPLVDITASGINQASPTYRNAEVNKHRLAAMPWGNHFGVVRVDWSRADPLIRLELRDEDNDVAVSHRIPLSALKPRGKVKSGVPSPSVNLADGETSPETARGMVGKKVSVRFRVASAGKSKDGVRIFLNSSQDFRGGDNLAIVLELKGLEAGLKKKGILSPQNDLTGQVIRVTGIVSTFRDAPQIIVASSDDFEWIR